MPGPIPSRAAPRRSSPARWLAPALVGLGACATAPAPLPDLPLDPPRPVGMMLRASPPLPGEPAGGWVGLEPVADRDTTSMQEAVELALRRSGDLAAAERDVEAAGSRARQAGALPDPRLELEVVGRDPSSPLEAGVEIDLTGTALSVLRGRAEDEAVRAAELRARAARLRLAYEVRTAYRAVQAAREGLIAAHRSLDALAASSEMAGALGAAGNVPALFVDSHAVAYEEARDEAARAEAALVAARATLTALLGEEVEVEAGLRLPDAGDPPHDVARRAVDASLELAELARLEERALRRSQALGVAGWVPDVSVRAFGEREDGRWAAGAGVEVGLPIFGAGRSAARAEGDAAAALAARRRALALRVAAEARRLEETVRSTRARALHLAATAIPARERVLAQTLLQYNAMQLDVFELLRAHRGLLRVRLVAAAAARDHADAVDALDTLLAGVRVEAASAAAALTEDDAGPAGGGH